MRCSFRDPFFHHFSVFAFVSWWITKLKAGWHPHTAPQASNTKDNSRGRDSFLSSEWHICLNPLGFLLLTQHRFLSLCPWVCVSTEPLLSHRAAQRWKEPAGPGAMSELAERHNVLPKGSCGRWPGPALAKAPWPASISSVCAKIKLANILPHHRLQQLN